MKLIILFFMSICVVLGSEVSFSKWANGDTFLTYLHKHEIHNRLYFDLEKEGRELCSEITSDTQFQEMYDDKGKLTQALIPISEEMQIHLYKVKEDDFQIEFIPIIVREISQTITIGVQSSIHQDIYNATNNILLANEVTRAFKKTINFKKLQKNDDVSIKYTQKVRFGQYFGTPDVSAAMVEVNKEKNYIFKYSGDDRFYDKDGKSLVNYFFKVPVQYTRISDGFTNKRWHPILKKYKAHLGIDYAAPTGRKIYAAADGKITFKGTKGGYGNVIIISHNGNYNTLYGHMHRFASVKVGQFVKQGTLIGYVGSTGLSTGSHLHFGMYLNNKAIDPDKIITVARDKLKDKEYRTFTNETEKYKKEIEKSIKERPTPIHLTASDVKMEVKVN